MRESIPSVDAWLRQAKADAGAANCGMFLIHNGVVRRSAKARVRQGDTAAADVTGMYFSYDRAKVDAAVAEAETSEGLACVRVWLNEGEPCVGDGSMCVLSGGDIRPRVIDALQVLVGKIKNECVTETELHA